MREYKNTYVAPPPALPALHRPLQVEIDYSDVDPNEVFARANVRTIERTDPMAVAKAFAVRYAALSVILAILAVGVTWTLQWHLSAGIVTFALLCIVGYGGLAAIDHRLTGAGVERHRLTMGAKVMLASIDAN